MRLEALVEIQNDGDTYKPGSQFDAALGVARDLIRYGIAKEVAAPVKSALPKRNQKRTRG